MQELFDLLVGLQKGLDPDFVSTSQRAAEAYVKGDWSVARDLYNAVLEMKPNDGPAAVIMGVMEKTAFVSPKEWEGYRPLTKK